MMIDCNLIALNNPTDILPYPSTDSGLLDEHKGYIKYGYKSSDFPILNMPYILEDKDGNSIPPGHYQIVLNPNRTMLYFVESNQIKASIPVAKLVEKMVNEEEEQKNLKQKEKEDKKYRFNKRKKPLNQTERKKQADMEASLDNSNAEYYILKYRNGNIKAEGYIIK